MSWTEAMGTVDFLKLLRANPAYNVVGHTKPDGDSVGSQLAIHNVLAANGIRCSIVANDDPGPILAEFLRGYPVVAAADCDHRLPLICVDCADLRRVGPEIAGRCGVPYLNIDHHVSNENFAVHNIVVADVSSTAEVIASLLMAEGIDFDRATAEALYLGIMTDSGRFAYDTTTLATVKIVGALMAKGISISAIYRAVYERESLARYRLLVRFLHNLTVFNGGRCSSSFLIEEDFVETGTIPLDTEGFVNYARGVDGVVVGALVEFHDTHTKCSLRSKNGALRLDLFAKRYGGGGHPAAAGFTLQQSYSPAHIESSGKTFYGDFQRSLAAHVERFGDRG
jgi:phosphoesterase RecJ-like protein